MLKTRDYNLWTVGTIVPPKTKAQKLARKNELKAKSTLLLAILDEHLLKFHSIKDAKSLWKAIKIRFGGNKESKKMYKTILKQKYKNFVASRSEGLDKPMIGQSSSGSNSHNIAFVSSENTSNINETITAAHDIPATGLKEQPSAWSYADDIDTDDLEEMDLKWQVAMITIRVKKFMKRTWRNLNLNGKEQVGFDKTKAECYNSHIRRNFARECRAPRNQGNRSADNERRVVPVETPSNALVVQDGLGGYD
nr:ribonuclease H-like domain-containing protein [Tanacetum cinerariifolium]